MGTLRIAIAQIRGSKDDVTQNKKRIMEMIERACNLQADYLVFPECFLTGSSQLPCELPSASELPSSCQLPASSELPRELPASSELPSADLLSDICAHAKRYEVGVIIGMVESDGEHLYNAAVLIGKDGRIAGSYRKIHLFEYEQSRFSPGRELPVFELPEVRMGIMINHDMEFPEVARILAIRGAQLLVVLSSGTILDTERDTLYLRGRAMENHLFVVVANKVGLEENQLFAGNSKWIDPTGSILWACSQNEEVSVQDIDLNEIEHTKGALDYLKNRRPDVYAKEGYQPM
ncbi:carbon-nitrogen hydrolase family protein [Brevibacillus fluminis]|uniref:Carbon-nitrogen hydrolase family protein n=1 Tax=Brevibacillus fluminis TaxID=511487 RepID=A0A3M8DP04_9BACL|nr:carbon-nitrogen hydrolase family protein [Brevibacillus fluminis]RNB89764.1 carbon-nitrogen hydrolase family protein [Brevibacillus fluminis]